MGKTVLIVGGGGREHALVWALARSPEVSRIVCAPGNAGIAREAEVRTVAADDVAGLVRLAESAEPDLVVVGPEVALCAGLADALVDRGIPVFGPTKAAAELEGSKAFAKQLMAQIGVPTADFFVATDLASAQRYIGSQKGPLVVKADGLCAGKGVVVCKNEEQAQAAASAMLGRRSFGTAGSRIVIEERLTGREASLMALCDGQRIVMLESAEDHKAVFDGDEGPNTGGMGAYCPSPRVDASLRQKVRDQILGPVMNALAQAGRPYRGVLYAGLMLTPDRGPMVLEFNCRFGDPETQVVLPRFASDLYPWLLGVAQGRMPDGEPAVDPRAAVCVVQCSGGYPGPYDQGIRIQGIEETATLPDVMVFHAGTARDPSGAWVTAGGRVLGVTALDDDVRSARARAYEAVARISWKGEHHRTDIADRSAA